jgi:pyruvate formate lyase activating enzyme
MLDTDSHEYQDYYEALYYEKLDDGKVRCRLCPQLCLIGKGETGFCFIRKNIDGALYAMMYGHVSSAQLDPIEKKPFYNFHPGSTVYSIGGIGCNLRCSWCQNWTISQPRDYQPGITIEEAINELTEPMTSKKVIELASNYRRRGCIGVAYTYNEPFIWYEFMRDTAKAAKADGMVNALVTNGYVMPEPLADILPYVDAMNIDIKGMSESFYRRLHAHLGPVLKTAKTAKEQCHVEITNLVIPGLNDSPEDFEKLVDWIADSLGRDTPLHFSRYLPRFEETRQSTDVETLKMAESIARKKLDYVYLGNVW